jgi:hypothetical protein
MVLLGDFTFKRCITTTGVRGPYDWTLPNIVDDDALRSVFLAKTDGSGVCPTGLNVPTEAQLKAETATNTLTRGALTIVEFWMNTVTIKGQITSIPIPPITRYNRTSPVVANSANIAKARDLTFDRYSIHPEFYNSERSAGESIRCIRN